MDSKIRKIPKKSKIIIFILILLAIILFLLITYLRELKIKEILNSLGYFQISNIKVINKFNVEDKDTKIKGTVYKVLFFNKENQECIGFLHKNKSNKYFEDFDCK